MAQGWQPHQQGNWQQQTYPGPPPPSDRGKVVAAVVGAVAVLVVLAAVAGFFLLRGDDGGDGAEPAALAQPAASAPTAKTLAGTWDGTYTCAQGLTKLRLVLSAPTADGVVTGTFSFSPHDTNPTVPTGSFEIRGNLIGGALEMSGEKWIRQPTGFEMIDLSATVADPSADQIQGTVAHPTCSSFSVRRTG